MIQNRIQCLSLDSIFVPREHRQRTDLTPESVLDLAISIGKNQWISPILVAEENNQIVAGERRYTAVSLLRTAYESRELEKVDPIIEQLIPHCNCKIDAWKNWSAIPAQIGRQLSDIDISVFEFIENKERQDLSWQDKAKAVYVIHSKCLTNHSAWTSTHTAQLLGIAPSTVSQYLSIQRAWESADPKLQEIIIEAPTKNSALASLERVKSRREQPLVLGRPLAAAVKPTESPLSLKDEPLFVPEPVLSLGEQLVLCADFHEFAKAYDGEPFNFIHCDFPYGIEFNRSGGQNTAIDMRQAGDYDDSEEVYWNLIRTLGWYKQQLLAPSSHIMFWYSQNLYDETRKALMDYFPEATIQKFPMIWHCADNSGLMPDPQRYGRRTYETALLITLGDRKVATGKALSFAHPRGQAENKVHRSQKPIEVLFHFFRMFVDDSTRMFDPTCGSATSLITAKRLGAASVLGIELDPDMQSAAVNYINKELKS
jgi:DNA modification methylase